MKRTNKSNVGLIRTNVYVYPKKPPFRPSKDYPELYIKDDISQEPNRVFDMVREGFRLLGYDLEHYGHDSWNPLKDYIKPGDKVVLKPNLVLDRNHNKGAGEECLYTHPSVAAAVIEYVLIALGGKGEIVVGDAPVQECNFARLIKESGYEEMTEYYNRVLWNDVNISLVDFRDLHSVAALGMHKQMIKAEPDGMIVNLGENSEFSALKQEQLRNLRITNYDPDILAQHHNETRHEYCINRHILEADAVINLPKPKTHRKAGVTISLKNIVGMNARKEYLPHHTNGAKENGGDEYLSKSWIKERLDILYDRYNRQQANDKFLRALFSKAGIKGMRILLKLFGSDDGYEEGSWYGNDTISRTIVDLNRILKFADKEGMIQSELQRRQLIVADMIISGEGEGPLEPSPKKTGIIAIGDNPVCFDEVIATLMGARLEMIPTIIRSREEGDPCPFVVSNYGRWNKRMIEEIREDGLLYFIPTAGWKRAFKRRCNRR